MFWFVLSNSSFAVYYVSIALWLFTPEALFECESRLILNFSQSVTFDTQHKNPLYTYIPYYIPWKFASHISLTLHRLWRQISQWRGISNWMHFQVYENQLVNVWWNSITRLVDTVLVQYPIYSLFWSGLRQDFSLPVTSVVHGWLLVNFFYFCFFIEHRIFMEVAYAFHHKFKFAISTALKAVEELP